MRAPTLIEVESLWRLLVRGAKRNRGQKAEIEFVSQVYRLDGVAVQATIRMEICPVVDNGGATAKVAA
jgi:hypothetical protein